MIYYVAMTGNDANAGTFELPFKTIQKAADIVLPGDKVIVRDGNYTNIIPNYESERVIVWLTRSGTVELPIIFESENLHGAVIDGSDFVSEHGFLLDGVSNIEVNGFAVKDISIWGIPALNCTNVKFNYNHVYNIGNIYITDLGDLNGRVAYYAMSCTNVVINGNKIHNIGRQIYSPEYPDAVRYTIHDHGIYLDNVVNATVSNCEITDCNRGWGIHVYSGRVTTETGMTYASSDIKILNNTIYTKNQQSPGVIVLATPITGLDIANNILILSETEDLWNGVVQANNVGIYGLSDYLPYITAGTIRNNITKNGATTISTVIAGVAATGNMININPLITSLAAYDFNLMCSSPAINAGVDVSVTTDLTGNVRVTRDIGAFKYIQRSEPKPAITIVVPAPVILIPSVNYTTKQGERWDLLSYRFYGSVKSMNILIEANPSVPLDPIIEMGTALIIPIIDNTTESIIVKNIPPWK